MKIVVAHPSRQHSYHTAIAIKNAGYLDKYITTVYNSPHSLTRIVSKVLKGNLRKKAEGRFCQELNGYVYQIDEFWGLSRIFFGRFIKSAKFHVWVMQQFAKHVAQYVISNKIDVLIIYDGFAYQYLDIIKAKCPKIKIVMDVTIGTRQYMKEIFEKDMQATGNTKLYKEEPLLWDLKYMGHVVKNFEHIDYALAPSDFVVKSLEFAGVNPNKIVKIPYGVNSSTFKGSLKQQHDGPIRFLFVGNLSYRKGVHHLLKVVSLFSSDKVCLTLAGGYDGISLLYNKYHKCPNIHFAGFVTHDVLQDYYRKADFFVLPSLAEGFALVILEALSTGTPVLCSENSGGNDAIVEGKNGFVIKAGGDDELYDCISNIINNKHLIPQMSEYAMNSSKDYSWNNYYNRIGYFINHL